MLEKNTRVLLPTGLAMALSWPLGVNAACEPDPQFGFVCNPAGNVALGLVGPSTDSGVRQNVALVVAEELLDKEKKRDTGGGSGDSIPFDVYATLLYGNKDYDSQELPGLDSDSWGGVIGAYLRDTQYFAGAAIDYSTEDADLKENAGGRDTDEWGVQVYGTYFPLTTKELFLTGAFRYSSLDIDTQRTFLAVDPNDPSGPPKTPNATRGSTDGVTYSLHGGAGYSWPIQPQTLITLSGWLSWQRNEIDGYNETGGLGQANNGAFTGDLRFADDNYDTFDGIMTASLTHSTPIANGELIPSASVSYVHEFESDTRTINADVIDIDAAASGADNKFVSFTTNKADKNYMRVALGLAAEFNQGTTIYAGYNGTLAHEWRNEHLFSLSINQTF